MNSTEKELTIEGQLQQAQRETRYYQKLARECGERRLKESKDLSRLIAQLRQTEKELAHARDELELRVQEHTAELEATNTRLLQEMHERQQIADELHCAHESLQQSHDELEHERQHLEIRVQERTREILHMQQERVRELATPLIPLLDHVVIMPLIGTIDSERAEQVMETLLAGIEAQRATIAILDITGVCKIDTQVAQTLLQATRACRMLGARVILTGIQPRIAESLVLLGANLDGIVTRSTLQAGIAEVLRGNHANHFKHSNHQRREKMRV
jgi:anti-anti-sigma factor